MAKLVVFLILFIGCSNVAKKGQVSMSISMRDNLFAQQTLMERYKNINDEFFLGLSFDDCLLKWEEEVTSIKNQLRKVVDPKMRTYLWYRLGNCYHYVDSPKFSLYYYDLALSSNLLPSSKKSVVSYNFARAYSSKGLVVLAENFYRDALKEDPSNGLAAIELSLLYTNQGDYKQAMRLLRDVQARFKKSDFVRFLIGVNYFGLDDSNSLQSKVIPYLNDKSIGAKLLLLANDYLRRIKKKEDLLDRLGNIEAPLPPYRAFKDLLRVRIDRSLNDKKQI